VRLGGDIEVISIRWRRRWFRDPVIIVESDEVKREYPVQASQLPRPEGVHLRSKTAADQFARFLHAIDFGKVLWAGCSGGEPTVFLFDLVDGPWQLPWELALASLQDEKAKAAYTPARIVGSMPPIRPSKRAEKLRITILEGYPGDVPNRIRPDLEASGIVAAWEQLDPALQNRIEKPQRVVLDPVRLPQVLSEQYPHILWYCGHGRASPAPGLLYASEAWMSASEFAASIPTMSPPECVALWACELAEASPNQEATAPAPEIHRAVASRGVRVTLAMQSRVNDIVARVMAKELFNGLAIGLSLERAAARARHHGQALPFARFDWASPAVWLARAPTRKWEWGQPPADPLIERLVAWLTVKQAQKVPELDESDVDTSRQAYLWNQKRRVIVQADSDSEAVMMTLARVADATLRKLDTIPVFIRMRRTSPIASIKDWAKEILAWAEPEALPTALGSAVRFAIDDQQSTPRRLLEIENTMLVFIDPPEDNDSAWFMDVVAESRRSAPLVLVTRTMPTDQRFDSWTRDTMIIPAHLQLIERHIADHLAKLLALAILDLPLPENVLSAIGFSRDLFPIGTPFIFETRTGPILSAWAKRLVLESATEDQIRAAHEACLVMLEADTIIGSERLRREKLRHLIGARRDAEALVEASRLMETYYLDGRYAAVTECFELLRPLGKTRDSCDTLALLRVAEAYVRIGKPTRAKLHLRNCHPEDPLQRAVMLALDSEIEKNDGTAGWRERAVASISKAIEACREAQHIDHLAQTATVVLSDYKMNLARLRQYLDYDLDSAEVTYREILKEVSNSHDRNFLVAAVERNLAECIVTRSPGESTAQQEAEALLNDAEARLQQSEPLRAEIAYVRTKLATARGAAFETLLHSSAQIARQTGNGMVEAIADAKLFWSREAFHFDRWRRIERALAPYHHHGWAIRTAMNGRISAARQLAARGMRAEALELLRRNVRELEARPGRDRGTDRDRIAYTLAGIVVLSTDDAEAAQCRHRADTLLWMKSWLRDKGFTTLDEAWQKE